MLEEDKRGILLESGTNEIEVMEFTIDNNLYGINVAKVKEILVSEPVKPMPHVHPAVEGIFKPRDIVITVVGISRISWKDIQKPDKTASGGPDRVATGIAQCGGNLVTILDFEKIVAEIAPETSIQVSEIDQMGHRERSDARILVAEDSVLLSKMIEESLHKAGYVNTTMFPNGQELWDMVVFT